MPKRAGGLIALIDGPYMPKCASCGAVDPDPASNGYCQECGSVFPERLARRFHRLQVAVGAGAAVFLGGGTAALWFRQPRYSWCALGFAAAGLMVIAWTALQLRRTSQGMQAAARMRDSDQLTFFWTQADRRSLMLLGLFAATLAALMPYVWFVHAPRFIKSSTEAAFFGRLQEYVDLARDRSKPIDPKIAGQPRRAFKIVVIDLEEKGPRISPTHYLLPPEIRAATPDEVGTVALMRYDKVQVARYEPGNQPAYEYDGEMTLINLAKKQALERRKFRGGPPPREVPSGGEGYGTRPAQSVAGYLKSLPVE